MEDEESEGEGEGGGDGPVPELVGALSCYVCKRRYVTIAGHHWCSLADLSQCIPVRLIP